MDTIKTTSRIHPLMAGAAVSVIVVSLAGAAAITGLLPSSHSTPEATAPLNTTALAPNAQPNALQTAQPVQSAYDQAYPAAGAQPVVAQTAPAPVVIEKTIIKEAPVKTASHTRPAAHHTSYAHDDGYVAQAPRPAPQPNYVAIGTGAVLGGLVGNQVGSGNGRKLATVAGIIGGGMLGNQIANQNR